MAINLNGNAESTYSSDISAAAGTFSGDLSAANGTFSGTGAIGGPLQVGTDGAGGAASPRGMIILDSAGASPPNEKPLFYHKQNVGLAIRTDYQVDFERLSGGVPNVLSARIDQNGNFKIGGSPDGVNGSPNITLNANGEAILQGNVYGLQFKFSNSGINNARYGYDAGNNRMIAVNVGNGVYLAQNGANWQSISDQRFKTSLTEISDGLEKVSKIKGYTGQFINDKSGLRRPFLIAQEVAEVIPEAVDQSNPEQLGMAYQDVVPLLVSALHDAKDRIEALEAEVQALKGGNS